MSQRECPVIPVTFVRQFTGANRLRRLAAPIAPIGARHTSKRRRGPQPGVKSSYWHRRVSVGATAETGNRYRSCQTGPAALVHRVSQAHDPILALQLGFKDLVVSYKNLYNVTLTNAGQTAHLARQLAA